MWDAGASANGDHSITVIATDLAGNITTETIDVELERTPDRPPRSTSQGRLTINGTPGEQAGAAVAALGDINEDGYADYAVGAPTAGGTGRANAGATYIVLGRETSTTINLANPGAGTTRILGPTGSSFCGSSIAAVGDVNGDGVDDLIVGCPGLNTQIGALSSQGKAYVLFGSTTPQDVDLASLGSQGFAVTGPQDSLTLGLPLLTSRPSVFAERLSGAPRDGSAVTQDVNGDGLADIVVGDSAVPRASQTGAGATYVILGKTDGAPVDVGALGSGGFVVRGIGANTLSGYSAAIIGDVTGDGLADLAIGAPGATPTTGAAAYIVAGSDSSSDVDLAAPAGRAVKLTTGQAEDRFGVNATGLGDTDLNGHDDVAIATRSGAYIVRSVPTADKQISVADGYVIAGPINQPALLSTMVPGSSVGAAGDVDDDGRGDVAVGYPDAIGTGRGYIVQSPEASRTVTVTALPGQRGVALTAGTQADRSGASIAANAPQADSTTSEPAQAILGAPNSSPALLTPSAGRAYVLTDIDEHASAVSQSARAAATAASTKGCYNGRTTPYPFDVKPDARYGYRVAVNPGSNPSSPDDDTSNYRDSAGLPAIALLPRCRQTLKKRIDRVPTGLRKYAAAYTARPFNGSANAEGQISWAIRDSFNRAFATVRQTVVSVNGKRAVIRWQVIRDSDDAVVLDSPPAGLTSVSVQGYACFAQGSSSEFTDGDRVDRVMFAVRPGTGGGAGVRGFIDRSALKSTYIKNDGLRRGRTGCRNDRGLSKPLSTPAPLEEQGVTGDFYQGRTSARNACPTDYTRPNCGASYDSYEPTTFPGIKIMALSSTGVTGGEDAAVAGGGVAMAVVTDGDEPFARLDRLNYNDPNVPCSRTPSIRWVFGRANYGLGQRPIYGWLPEVATTTQPARQCPAHVP